MRLDARAIEPKAFDPNSDQALPLKRFENPFEHALLRPPAKPHVEHYPSMAIQ